MFIEGNITTRLGNIGYAITQGDHVSLSTGDHGKPEQQLVYRGNFYYVHLHLYLVDGIWQTKQSYDCYVSRNQMQRTPEPTPVAIRAMKEAVTTAWTEYAALHPELLIKAQVKHLRSRILTKEQELTKLKEQLQSETLELTGYTEELSELVQVYNIATEEDDE